MEHWGTEALIVGHFTTSDCEVALVLSLTCSPYTGFFIDYSINFGWILGLKNANDWTAAREQYQLSPQGFFSEKQHHFSCIYRPPCLGFYVYVLRWLVCLIRFQLHRHAPNVGNVSDWSLEGLTNITQNSFHQLKINDINTLYYFVYIGSSQRQAIEKTF